MTWNQITILMIAHQTHSPLTNAKLFEKKNKMCIYLLSKQIFITIILRTFHRYMNPDLKKGKMSTPVIHIDEMEIPV